MGKTSYKVFPFSAVVGQDKVKKALLFNVINPQIGGVLISGEKGSAKSTLVRGLAHLLKCMEVVNLPLNITEDRLLGGIDMGKAIKLGEKALEGGILQKAHGQFLYIDEVNLLSEYIVNILLEVSSSKVNFVEREGISNHHSSDFILVGSMNPEEGVLRSQLLDRFGLYIEVKGEEDIESRTEIMRRYLEFEKEPVKFMEKWNGEDEKICQLIEEARRNIKEILPTHENYQMSAALAQEGKCAGHRAEITLMETAKAVAALKGNMIVTAEDIKEAAGYALPHRIRESISFEEELEETESNGESTEEDTPPPPQEESQSLEEINSEDSLPYEETGSEEYPEEIQDIMPISSNLKIQVKFEKKSAEQGSGKRSKVKTDLRQGRYVKSKIPHGSVQDIAFDATFRIAVTHQKYREKNGLAVRIQKEDLREKVREKHTGAILLFLVDASSSVGAGKRMGAVKGAVLSLLNDAYQKRDRIGIVAFRKEKAEVLLDITRSVDLAQKCLKKIPTGGKTPLAAGLEISYQLLKAEKIKSPDSLQYLILLSDGKGNVPLTTDQPLEEAYLLGEKIRNEGIKTMVLDTESSYIQHGFAKELAAKMGSEYVKLSNITKGEVISNVGSLVTF